jgi:hypothetical protein
MENATRLTGTFTGSSVGSRASSPGVLPLGKERAGTSIVSPAFAALRARRVSAFAACVSSAAAAPIIAPASVGPGTIAA